MISFIFYFSIKRIENLKQTLRLLKKRENLDNSEVILVCNENVNENFDLPNYRIINLNLPSYHKPKMCNIGVLEASNEVVALLDSDRILPYNYFEKNAKKIKPKQFLSTTKLFKLIKNYTDEDIELNNFEYAEDEKSKRGCYLKKNLFSGNTMFFKKDYLDCEGMDENFIGYGFADNDMSIKVSSRNYKVLWLNEIELHLHHDTEFLYHNEIINDEIKFKKISHKNLSNLIEKWQFKNISNFLKII